MGYHFGIDIGGTFTDLFVVEEGTDRVFREKVSTTPEDFSRGFLDAIEGAFEGHDIAAADVTYLAHGTTVATNAILEREGVRTGLLATEGFGDVTAIAREDRPNVYELSPVKTPTFTERRHRVGVPERISAAGEVLEPLDEAAAIRAVDHLSESGIESVAVALLHSYRNDAHERRLAELVRERTDMAVSRSSSVMPEIREYERTISTVIDAYVGPTLVEYISALETGLETLGLEATLHLMQASGGVLTPEHLGARSLGLINSGPAAGVVGARRYAEVAGFDDVITLDMGGTSADASVIHDGTVETTTEGDLDGIPLLFPQVDIRTVGAGGGSVVWLDPTDVLKVGPKSQGADPGPACYGRGGERPTVTDAALVLGYLDPGYFLGGEMSLDETAARESFAPLCDELGIDLLELADGVLEIAATNMTQVIRRITVEKGYDPRTFVFVPYGGAGPLFATRLADRLGVGRVLVPPAPGVLSAAGLLTADKRFDLSRSSVLPFEDSAAVEVTAIYDGLEAEAAAVSSPTSRNARSVDLRYTGQTSHLDVPFPDGTPTPDRLAEVRERFHAQYESTYGHALDERVEAVTWRLRVTEETPASGRQVVADTGSVADAVKGTREVYSSGDPREFTVYDRYRLPAGGTFHGPAIVEESESTTVVETDASVRVEETGSLLVGAEGVVQ